MIRRKRNGGHENAVGIYLPFFTDFFQNGSNLGQPHFPDCRKSMTYRKIDKRTALIRWIKAVFLLVFTKLSGRSDWTRTSGLLVPNQAHYQAVPHPVIFSLVSIAHSRRFVKPFSEKTCLFGLSFFLLSAFLRKISVPFPAFPAFPFFLLSRRFFIKRAGARRAPALVS